jgi:DinB superfamily
MNASPNPVAMPVADKDNLLTLLHDTRLRFLSSLAGVSDDASRLRPAEGCWSVLDCVEHIAGAEAFMFRILKESRHPRSADAPNREEDFLRRMVDRSVKARTPERGQPRGRFANLEEARNQFVTARGGNHRLRQSEYGRSAGHGSPAPDLRRRKCVRDADHHG